MFKCVYSAHAGTKKEAEDKNREEQSRKQNFNSSCPPCPSVCPPLTTKVKCFLGRKRNEVKAEQEDKKRREKRKKLYFEELNERQELDLFQRDEYAYFFPGMQRQKIHSVDQN